VDVTIPMLLREAARDDTVAEAYGRKVGLHRSTFKAFENEEATMVPEGTLAMADLTAERGSDFVFEHGSPSDDAVRYAALLASAREVHSRSRDFASEIDAMWEDPEFGARAAVEAARGDVEPFDLERFIRLGQALRRAKSRRNDASFELSIAESAVNSAASALEDYEATHPRSERSAWRPSEAFDPDRLREMFEALRTAKVDYDSRRGTADDVEDAMDELEVYETVHSAEIREWRGRLAHQREVEAQLREVGIGHQDHPDSERSLNFDEFERWKERGTHRE
jgi:hypothetical protein